MTQVHPLLNSEPQNPQEIINIGGLRSDTGNSHGTHHYSNPAFVVEIFLRENPEVQTIQPGQEEENMDEDICRICLDTKDKEDLVRVCRCKGSAKYAHKSCILRWFQFSCRYECELCHYKMKIKKDGLKPVREWSNPCRLLSPVDFLAVFFFHILQAIVLLLVIMIAVSNKCFSLVCISLIMFCFAVAFLLFYCCDGYEYFKYRKVQWVVNNSRWSISSYDEESTHQ